MNGNARKMLMRNGNSGIILAVIVVLAGSTYLAYGTGLLEAAVSISAIAIAVLLFYSAKRKKRIIIRKPEGFVHAKIYISENEAIHGSANLTYNGTHSNIEHIEIIRDNEKIAKLHSEFERMWKKSA
jgi:phosphatidylserine/phosphatidylglycerophosphate/cardiolipin synthase-like enzyme